MSAPYGSEYVIVHTSMAWHRRFVRAGAAAVGFWTAALAWTRHERLDGWIPDYAVGIPLAVGEREGRKFAELLVTAGLFALDETRGGYVLLGYVEKGNETKEQIEARLASGEAKRDADRERQRKWRESHRDETGAFSKDRVTSHRDVTMDRHGVTSDTTPPDGVTEPVTNAPVTPQQIQKQINSKDPPHAGAREAGPEHCNGASCKQYRAARGGCACICAPCAALSSHVRAPEPRTGPPVNIDGASYLAADWARGVSSVTGAPCPTPTGGELRKFAELVAACEAEFPGPEWATLQGSAYARFVAARGEEKIHVFGFIDWVRGGRKPGTEAPKRGRGRRATVLQPRADAVSNGNGSSVLPTIAADDALSRALDTAGAAK